MKHIKNFTFFRFIIFLIAIVPFYFGCTYNKEDEMYQLVCDTTNINYEKDIKPVLVSNCLNCHGVNADRLGDKIRLDSYENARLNADNILEAVKRSNDPMPRGGSRLPACTISKIDLWIKRGTPEK
jgi:hypothetical protein